MSLSDWSEYNTGDWFNISSDRQTEGNGSLLYHTGQPPDHAMYLDQSATDSPTEGRVESMTYAGGDTIALFAPVFRYASGSFYAIRAENQSLYDGVGLRLMTTDDGPVDSDFSFDTTLSDGTTNFTGRWIPWAVDFWQDSGTVWARVYEDADGDGTWTQWGPDLNHTSPRYTGGGAIGLGTYGSYYKTSTPLRAYYDETEVFY
jgi:hypothetical protein